MDGVRIDAEDMRVGMGIGGWDMRYTATHEATGCKVVWETHGSFPASQRLMRERALMALELLVEVYLPKTPKTATPE